MRSVIRQSVTLPAKAEQLFQMYVSPELHGAFTGMPVTISDSPGSPFSAFDGALSGSMLQVVKPSIVVQSWRSVSFYDSDPDSTLILYFHDDGDEGRIELIHLDVPEQDYDGVTEGWERYYWKPWREYLESQSD
jgi:activator of HSP90 ATPase